ncbi:hypothetical protein HZH68_012254 [Vespula germanica]|uniref:Uncharacterized protein n=1 Tax=Vespula germanica TaxID=30212 RepID=A0A834JI43_VESGE|nr:hypothetical protein HZH68_012254 [Vespula germanica]
MFSSLMFQGVRFSPTTAVTAPSVPRTLYMRSGLYQGSYIVSSNLFVELECSREIFRYRYMPILPSRTEVNYASRPIFGGVDFRLDAFGMCPALRLCSINFPFMKLRRDSSKQHRY